MGYRIGKGGKITPLEPPTEQESIHVQAEIQAGIEKEKDRILGASTSQGASWLAQYRLRNPTRIESFDFGELGSWHIRELSADDLDILGCMMTANGGRYGVVELPSLESRSLFSRALLYVGVCSGPNNPARKFADFTEASIFYQQTGIAFLVSSLRDSLLDLNPCFLGVEGDGTKKLLAPTDFG